MGRLISATVVAVFTITALGAAAGPGQTAAQSDAFEPAVIPGTVVVDDLSAGFRRTGSGWRSSAGGYDDHHYWVPAKRSLSRVGIWTVTVDEPGLYRVLAKVPRWHASTRKAVYKVKTADGWVKRVRNQYANRGSWVSLGTLMLPTTAEVRLGDKTLDPRGTSRKLAFDALKFVPIEPPEPPVITRLDVEPKHDRAVVTFSLAEAGPAKTEYRKVGNTTWLVGANETSSKYTDHRQVIPDLKSATDYQLRVIATNKGGKTISPIIGLTTLPPPPPVIKGIVVKPEDTRAIVTFSLAEKGPARTEYRRPGDTGWILGSEETSSKYADHRQVITGLRAETNHELRVAATNAAGKTVSDIVPFTTRPRSVNCDTGEDLQQAIDKARPGDTIIIKGTCRGRYVVETDDLTLRGRDGATLLGDGTGTLITVPEFPTRKFLTVVGLRIEGGRTGVGCGPWQRCEFKNALVVGSKVGIVGGQLSNLVIRDSTLRGNGTAVSHSMQGGVWLYDSVVKSNGTGVFAESAVIEDSTIRGNAPGGGIRVQWLTLRRSRVLGNRADRGGGIDAFSSGMNGRVVIEDSIISGNRAATSGGGVWLETSELDASSISNTVIQDNTAGQDGGGLYVTGQKPTLTNVTFSGNTPNDCTGC